MTNKTPASFEDAVPDYIRQTGESRIKIVFPDVLRHLEKQKPESLLDYGCGPGIFLRDFGSKLSIPQVGYDVSADMLKAARENCLNVSKTIITGARDDLKPQAFDAVVKSAVWMHWKTNEECLDNLAVINGTLKNSGVLYAIVTHPAFRDESYSTFSLDLGAKKYLKDGEPYSVCIYDQNRASRFTDYHWSLGTMFDQLRRSGFAVEAIKEYPDTTEVTRGSPWLMFIARKETRPSLV